MRLNIDGVWHCGFRGCETHLDDDDLVCDRHWSALHAFEETVKHVLGEELEACEVVFLFLHQYLMRKNGCTHLKEDGPLLLDFQKSEFCKPYLERCRSHITYLHKYETANKIGKKGGCSFLELTAYLGLSEETCLLDDFVEICTVNDQLQKWVSYASLRKLLEWEVDWVEVARLPELVGFPKTDLETLREYVKEGVFGDWRYSFYARHKICISVIQLPTILQRFRVFHTKRNEEARIRGCQRIPTGMIGSAELASIMGIIPESASMWINTRIGNAAPQSAQYVWCTPKAFVSFLENAVTHRHRKVNGGKYVLKARHLQRCKDVLNHWNQYKRFPN